MPSSHPSGTALAAPEGSHERLLGSPVGKGADMSIINRRNAVLGWGVWQVAKVASKRKAKQAVPGKGEHGGLNKSAIAGLGAATLAALLFWRKKSDGSLSSGS